MQRTCVLPQEPFDRIVPAARPRVLTLAVGFLLPVSLKLISDGAQALP